MEITEKNFDKLSQFLKEKLNNLEIGLMGDEIEYIPDPIDLAFDICDLLKIDIKWEKI